MTGVADLFTQRYGRTPEVVASAPGRVNLIGEHTDYSLLPVLPMAIDRGVEIALARSPHKLEVHTTLTDTAGQRPPEAGWRPYLGVVVDYLGFEGGLVGLIDSDLPATGGLSSSTALTLGLMVAVATLDDREMSVESAVEATIGAERSAAVESGAMDQTVIGYGRAGHALRIGFRPPSMRHLPIPEHMAVVAGYSGTPAHKGGGARHAYNARVVGCRMATVLLGRSLGVDVVPAPVLAAVASHPDVLAAAAELPVDARPSAIPDEQIVGLAAGVFDRDESVPVRETALHVLTEARRVEAAEAALLDGDVAGIGRLFDESQASLVRFGASTPALGRLTTAMRTGGATGARLTGAGFGGYAVAVCPPEVIPAVIEAAIAATGGPAFEVTAADGVTVVDRR